jgi:hypothetical protein
MVVTEPVESVATGEGCNATACDILAPCQQLRARYRRWMQHAGTDRATGYWRTIQLAYNHTSTNISYASVTARTIALSPPKTNAAPTDEFAAAPAAKTAK